MGIISTIPTEDFDSRRQNVIDLEDPSVDRLLASVDVVCFYGEDDSGEGMAALVDTVHYNYSSQGRFLINPVVFVDKTSFGDRRTDQEILKLETSRGKWELLLRARAKESSANRRLDNIYFEALFRTYYQACKDGKLFDYILFRKNFLNKVFSSKKAQVAFIMELKIMQQALRLFNENRNVQFGLEEFLLDFNV